MSDETTEEYQETMETEEDEFSAFMKMMEVVEEKLLEGMNQTISRARNELDRRFKELVSNMKMFSEVIDRKAVDMLVNEDATFFVQEWDQFNNARGGQIMVNVYHDYTGHTEPINFVLKKGSKYRVTMIVEKVGEFEPPQPRLEFVGGH